ncbi:hypothetical protein F5Y16DRAFT_406174 [Xylariaceae sp. FL0255]|nr:hypothetical protein F5Y16DRAFT_406174 [Xylariaceae sp. FL0255]
MKADRVPALKLLIPKNGLKWPRPSLTSQRNRDKQVVRALKAKGTLSRPGVHHALTRLFEVALLVFQKDRTRRTESLVSILRIRLDWARLLPNTVFWEFLVSLLMARYRWESVADHTYPKDHPSCVRALDTFRDAIGDRIITDSEFKIAREYKNLKHGGKNALNADAKKAQAAHDQHDPVDANTLVLPLRPRPQILPHSHIEEQPDQMDIDE